MVDLIKEHYGNMDDDTSKAFTEGLDYVQEKVSLKPETLMRKDPTKMNKKK